MNQSNNRAVLFDLDGTLLDTAPDLTGAINELRVENGQDTLPPSDLAPMCSYGARGMLLAGLGMDHEDPGYDEARSRFIELYRARMTQDTRPFDGMRDIVRHIVDSGWHWGVVTNKAKALAAPIMDAMAFDPAPVCLVGGDEVAQLKPDPGSILLACKRAQLDPAACIYIGDSARDIQAGNAAGMTTIAVEYGYIPADDNIHGWQAKRVVKSVPELDSAILELQNAINKQQETRPA